jgi:acylphosphatase
MNEARHLVIHGRVQGVGFRYHMAHEAARLGVAGWVRNRSDGTVEAIIVGTSEALAGLLAWARKGPGSARVDQLNVELPEAALLAELDLKPGFVQRADA